jgi:glycosyltransferase involved in cell wall biosynthesis
LRIKKNIRANFLKEFIDKSETLDRIKNLKWIIGIGGSQKYKDWHIPFHSIGLLNNKVPDTKYCLIRVNADKNEISQYKKKYTYTQCKNIHVFLEINIIFISNIKEDQIIDIYKMGDVLVNPSQAESFGHHAIEACLMGIPVVFKKGTSIDNHFKEDSLPRYFWSGVDSHDYADWATEIEYCYSSLFSEEHQKADFYNQMKKSASTREFIINYSKSREFSWDESAKAMHNIILKNYL